MAESDPIAHDPVEVAQQRRHLYLLKKVKRNKVLSIPEIGELRFHEAKAAERKKKAR